MVSIEVAQRQTFRCALPARVDTSGTQFATGRSAIPSRAWQDRSGALHCAHGDGQRQARSTRSDVGADDGPPERRSHPFYRRLNQLLREHGFDDFAHAAIDRPRATVYPSLRHESELISRAGLKDVGRVVEHFYEAARQVTRVRRSQFADRRQISSERARPSTS